MTKFRTLDNFLETLPADEVREMKEYAQQAKEAYKLTQLREQCELNQSQLAKLMGVSQANISKVENGNDYLLSTLKKYVGALGGELNITAKMPNGDIRII